MFMIAAGRPLATGGVDRTKRQDLAAGGKPRLPPYFFL
jgi:hypothetical protein